jgi:hypothetical protein
MDLGLKGTVAANTGGGIGATVQVDGGKLRSI